MGDEISLRQYIEALMAAHEEAVKVRLEAHNAEHRVEGRSIDIARDELTHWKQAHNDWQRQMSDSRNTFLTKDEFYRAHSEFGRKIASLEKWVYIGIGISVTIPILIQVLVAVIKK
jgi:hypothetical protein